MLNILIVSIPLIGMLVVVVLASLPPRIKPLSREEMRETADWQRRLARKGVERPLGLTPVIGVGRAKEKQVRLLPARQW